MSCDDALYLGGMQSPAAPYKVAKCAMLRPYVLIGVTPTSILNMNYSVTETTVLRYRTITY